MLNNIKLIAQFVLGVHNSAADMHFLAFSFPGSMHPHAWGRYDPSTPTLFPVSTLRQHIRQLTALAYKESTYKSYSRAWQLFLQFTKGYSTPIYGLLEHQFMEFISYLSLSCLAPATIYLYVSGVRNNLCWWGLNTFQDSFVIKMMLKGVSAKHREPDICLPITRDILGQMCLVLAYIVGDPYLTVMYTSMLTLAFNGLLQPGEFTYSPHVVHVEHVWFQNGEVVLYFPSSKTHQFPFCQQVRIVPHPQLCPVACLLQYLHIRQVQPGVLFVTQNIIPVQYPAVLKLFHHLAQFLDLPAERYLPHSLRIGATTELYVKGFSNSIIKPRGCWASAAFQWYIHPDSLRRNRPSG